VILGVLDLKWRANFPEAPFVESFLFTDNPEVYQKASKLPLIQVELDLVHIHGGELNFLLYGDKQQESGARSSL